MRIEKLGKITAINADCMEVMVDYPDGYFDLAIVDPPYGIDVTRMSMGTDGGVMKADSRVKRMRKADGSNRWDMAIPSAAYFAELFRVSRNQVIWGGNYFPLPPTRCFVVWDKEQVLGDFSQVELAWTSFNQPAKLIRYVSAGFRQKRRDALAKIHPTQKPEALYRYLLGQFADSSFRILDTHGGSMTHATACHDLGAELVIVERNPLYFERAVKMVKGYQRQLTLPF
jgi:site-specific DNA-methyltransferase (adenine-specific)